MPIATWAANAARRARLLLNDGSGAFADAPAQAFADDAGCADSAAAFFDADGDGDFDLYVGSGDGGRCATAST
ncbi:MAG: FG-GAP-like repeat-containing protein [Verrucomicrobiales bacterium]